MPDPTPGARLRPLSHEEQGRAIGTLLGPDGRPLAPPGADGWMGPGRPSPPVAPRGEAAGRAFDYQQSTNLVSRPRSAEQVSFAQLRQLAESYDPVTLAIETRKDQMAELSFRVQPRKKPGQQFRDPADERCVKAEAFFRKPDREHYWDQWVRMLCDEQLVIDAPAIYRRDNRAGECCAAELLDGSTILRLLDLRGRRPAPPYPAYQQILKGLPAINYTSDELLYAPRNPRVWKIYGFSPVEQIIVTINTGIRRSLGQLLHYTEGNVPEALIGLPEEWTLDQIRDFQRYWDQLQSDPRIRRRARFVPGQFAFQPTRAEGGLMDQFDEWLVRIVCYAFSLPPLPFVKVMNRSTAETSYDAALREGLAPMMTWVKNVQDDIIANWLGWPDLETVWDDVRQLDPTEQLTVDLQELQRGIRGLDDLRASRGLDAVGLGPVVFGVGPLGFMTPQQMTEAIKQGLTMPQPPPPPDMMGMGPPGGLPPGADPGADPLANADPRLLAMLGHNGGPPMGGDEGGEVPDGQGWDEAGTEAGAMPDPPGAPPAGLPPAIARRLPSGDPRALVRQMLGRHPASATPKPKDRRRAP